MTDTIINGTLTFSQEAKQVVTNMRDRCHGLAAWYGPDHETTRKAERSLVDSLTTMIGLGGTVWTESMAGAPGLSLYGRQDLGIDYGVIFHKASIPDEAKDMPGAPVPGEWSVHS